MSKFQPPMLKDDVCRTATDKQTHKHTHTHTYKKHTYRVKTEETFFLPSTFSILDFRLKRQFPIMVSSISLRYCLATIVNLRIRTILGYNASYF